MFEKHCQICGIEVKKETTLKRFGKFFCSDEHVEKYTQMKAEREERESKEPTRGGGCC